MKKSLFCLLLLPVLLPVSVLFPIEPSTAQRVEPVKLSEQPDFTKGVPLPEGWTHDWNLGPTGMRGWMFSEKATSTTARQIYVTKVDEGSPADGLLNVGDVILGIDGQPFDGDPRTLLGRAITQAERKENGGKLNLLCWKKDGKKGKKESVVLPLSVLGSYSPTAPFNCEKSKRVFDQACAAIAKKVEEEPEKGQIITRALNAHALLASGDLKYMPLIKEQAAILSKYSQSRGVWTWQYAYVNTFLAEYRLATGDTTFVKDGLLRITRMIVDGQSEVGSWGHGFTVGNPKRLGGYGMMNAPGIPLTYSLALARRANIDVPGLDDAIQKSCSFLEFYAGKGSIPYGDHAPWIQTHGDNGKNEAAAVLFDFEGNTQATKYFASMAVASHGPERDLGHTGNFFNMTWALPAVVRLGPNASGAWLKEFGWYYDLARRWDGTLAYQGTPAARPEVYRNWDCTGAYLLGFAYPRRKTFLTGKKPSILSEIDRKTADALVEDGYGWNNLDRDSFYDQLSIEQLLTRLSSWSPVVRQRAGMALGRCEEAGSDKLLATLNRMLQSSSSSLYTRYGAAQAIRFQRPRDAAADAAIAALRKSLQSDDLWLRVLAAEALAGIGTPARVAAPDMLERMARNDPKNDPRGMEQRFLASSLFSSRNGLIGKSLDGIDREALYKAIREGLTNQDGRARSNIGSVYRNLSYKEIEPLLPEIYRAVMEPAPSGIMFADGIRTAGIELLTRHQIDKGMTAIVEYARNQKLHGSSKRLEIVLKHLLTYGAHAKSVVPELEKLIDYYPTQTTHPPARNREKVEMVKEAIKKINASEELPELIKLEIE